MPSARETYAALVADIIERLQAGVLPWRRPWVVERPTNLFTRKPYSGVNVLALMNAAEQRGFRSSSWITERQALDRGGRILPSEVKRPAHIAMLYMRSFTVSSTNGQSVQVRRLSGRSFPVYNLEQTRGLGRLEPPAPTLQLWNHACERLVENWKTGPRLVTDPSRARYRPAEDVIAIPEPSLFESSSAYYATLFHEMIHATGHPSRLARRSLNDPTRRFGSDSYAFEELVAELGSAFLCSEAGIGNVGLQDSAAYIDSWLKALSGDRNRLFLAAFLAERACDLVLGRVTGGRRTPKDDDATAAQPVPRPTDIPASDHAPRVPARQAA